MLTSSIITLAQQRYPDVSRVMFLEYLNQIQKMIYAQNAVSSMRLYSTTTGKDPVLTTVDGTYEYIITSLTGTSYLPWRINVVYLETIDKPTDVMVIDAPPSGYCKVIFRDNPGTQNYFIRGYKMPTELTSESMQLTVPDSYHLTHVFEGLCGIIENARNGKSEKWEVFTKILMPDLTKKLSDTNDTVFYVTPKGY